MAKPLIVGEQEYTTEDGQKVYGFFPELLEAKAIDREHGIYEVMISTGAEDRDGDVMHAGGGQFDNFRKNPVVLYAHDYRDLPIGRSLEEEVLKDQVRARFQFPTWGTYEKADVVHRMWDSGFLNAASIGFIPLKREPRGRNTEQGDFAQTGWDILEWELLEYSIVPVPANQEALRLAMKMVGMMDDAPLESGQKPYPNEHACRLRDPGDFQEDSFRRTSREHEGKKYSVIMGRLKGEDTMTEQAYRYPKDTWTAAEARTHCYDHDGAFEAAQQDIPGAGDVAEERIHNHVIDVSVAEERIRTHVSNISSEEPEQAAPEVVDIVSLSYPGIVDRTHHDYGAGRLIGPGKQQIIAQIEQQQLDGNESENLILRIPKSLLLNVADATQETPAADNVDADIEPDDELSDAALDAVAEALLTTLENLRRFIS